MIIDAPKLIFASFGTEMVRHKTQENTNLREHRNPN